MRHHHFFELHVAAGAAIGIKPAKRNGAPTTINLEGLLAVAPDKRAKWLADNTDQKLTGQAAETPDAVHILRTRKTVREVFVCAIGQPEFRAHNRDLLRLIADGALQP